MTEPKHMGWREAAQTRLDRIIAHGDEYGDIANAAGDDLRDILTLIAPRLRALEEALRLFVKKWEDPDEPPFGEVYKQAKVLLERPDTASSQPVEDLPGAKFASAGDDLLRKSEDRT